MILSIISTICHLRQKVKTICFSSAGTPFLLADEMDYAIAFPLLEHAFRLTFQKNEALGDYYDLLKLHSEKEKSPNFNRKDFERWTGYASTKSKMVLRDLVDAGFITVLRAAKSSRPAIYELVKDAPHTQKALITPEELAVALRAGHS